MTNEEAIKVLGQIKDGFIAVHNGNPVMYGFSDYGVQAFDMAIEALKAPTKNTNTPTDTSTDLISRADAIKALYKYSFVSKDVIEREIKAIPSADRPQGKWIDCKELPSTDRNVFIAYGTDNMKSVCIGHYEHNMKLWYEDKNFFATPIYDAMYWCEIPQFPTRMKGADDDR